MYRALYLDYFLPALPSQDQRKKCINPLNGGLFNSYSIDDEKLIEKTGRKKEKYKRNANRFVRPVKSNTVAIWPCKANTSDRVVTFNYRLVYTVRPKKEGRLFTHSKLI